MGDTPLGIKLLRMGMSGKPAVAHVVSVDESGHAWVRIRSIDEPVRARCAVASAALPPRDEVVGAEVVIVLEEGEADRPIITGFVRESLWGLSETAAAQPNVLIEGIEEVALRCGKASISLTADGRIVIKGTRLTSRATEANKVRGAIVLIN